MKRRLARFAFATAVVLVIAPAFASAPRDQYSPFNINDQTITDLQTGLTWERFRADELRTFSAASSYCAGLTLGARKWRLPTVKELLTLVDEVPHEELELNGSIAALAIDEGAFPNTPPGQYWSSSAYAPDLSYAWTVDFRTGETVEVESGNGVRFRCVSP